MKITIEFQHLEHTPALDAKITDRSEKFGKFFDGGNSHIKWHCYASEKQQYAEASLFCMGHEFHAKAQEENLYKAIEKVSDRLEKQLVKKKEKIKNRLHKKHVEPVHLDPEDAWQEHEEDKFDDVS